jgi:hypothetical protein
MEIFKSEKSHSLFSSLLALTLTRTLYQAAEKRPSAALPASFVIAAYGQVRLLPQDFGRLASGHS